MLLRSLGTKKLTAGEAFSITAKARSPLIAGLFSSPLLLSPVVDLKTREEGVPPFLSSWITSRSGFRSKNAKLLAKLLAHEKRECEHPSAPRQKKYVRVGFFRSGWRISKVPGRNACEIKMVHQEDAGLHVEMAKLCFAKGIWSYVCKMDNALRKYPAISRPQPSSVVTAVTSMQKVPPELDTINSMPCPAHPAASSASAIRGRTTVEDNNGKLSRRPSRKVIAKGLLLLGGVICLSRGHSSLGAKVAVAYILTKLGKRGASPSESMQS